MKRTLHRGGSASSMAASALGLLQRSITNGHRRLALLRLQLAVNAGAEVPEACWTYCRRAAETCQDGELRAIFLQATQQARTASACNSY